MNRTNTPSLSRRRRGARGMTLLVAMIMLVLLTMLALTSFNVGKSNLQIVNNMQSRDEAIGAANEVTDEAISSVKFYETPENALRNPCGAANVRCIDINSDGAVDTTVTLATPKCVKLQHVARGSLNLATESGRGCSVGDQQGLFGMENNGTGDSRCSDSVWNIVATVTDTQNESTAVEVVTGVAVRVPRDAADTNCAI